MFFLFIEGKFSGYTNTDNPDVGQFYVIPKEFINGYNIPVLDAEGILRLVEPNTLEHFELDPEAYIKHKIESSISFGNSLIVEYATANVLIGITQAGKTREVVDYFQEIVRYIQTGSLYETLNSVESLLASEIPEQLSPFVTREKLEDFKTKIQRYLTT